VAVASDFSLFAFFSWFPSAVVTRLFSMFDIRVISGIRPEYSEGVSRSKFSVYTVSVMGTQLVQVILIEAAVACFNSAIDWQAVFW
jgi:hypothetical protein